MYITIDPYYDTNFYNESKEALKNNEVDFREFINIKTFDWYFYLESKPIMVNYDDIPKSQIKFLVSKVIALKPNEEYLLLRRPNDQGKTSITKYIENEPMEEARKSSDAIFFNVRNRQELEKLSKEFPGKIWFLGKYYNKYRLCMSTNKMIKNYIDPDNILLEKSSEHNDPGRLEADLNYHILRGDMLVKFTETPYAENGRYIQPKIRGEYSSRFIL